MLAVLLAGCGSSSQEVTSKDSVEAQWASFRDASPQQYLSAVLSRYRSAASYHDRGIVRLGYTMDGRRESKIAPMRVWFDHDRLYVEAYDAKITSDVQSLTAWIDDPETGDFDSQVLRLAPIGRRPTLETLLPDPILATRVSGGLAGPPPQLEWLFARDPMKQLFHEGHRFQLGDSRGVNGRLCRNVSVYADGQRYQFWIDERSGVIRRVDLPPVAASPLPGDAVQLMSLSLELQDAAFDTPLSPPEEQRLPETPKFVRRFVPLPPVQPPAILGSSPGPFQLTDTTAELTITDRGGDRELLILVRYGDDPGSLQAVSTIASWNAGMPAPLRKRVRVAVLVDPRAGDTAAAGLGLPVFVDRGQAVCRSLGLQPGSLVILDSRGKVGWTQSSLSPAPEDQMVRVGAIVGDLLDGVDVPGRVQEQWTNQVQQYRRNLQRWRSEESSPGERIHLD